MSYTRVIVGVLIVLLLGITLIGLNDSKEKISDKGNSLPTNAITASSSISEAPAETHTPNTPTDVPAPPTKAVPPTLPTFTKETLAKYNGTDPSLPIYIAFEDNVYDVTAGKKFYEPGGAYDFLAGTDGTELLHIAGGEIIKKKYPVVGIYTETQIQ